MAVSLAAADAGVVYLFNRTFGKAADACEHMARSMPHITFRPAALYHRSFAAAAGELDLVVNCLGPGAEETVRRFDIDALPERAVWCDINYWMEDPPLLRACRERGLRTVDGLGMLLHQGALSFELFTGHPVAVAELEQIVSEGRDRPIDP